MNHQAFFVFRIFIFNKRIPWAQNKKAHLSVTIAEPIQKNGKDNALIVVHGILL